MKRAQRILGIAMIVAGLAVLQACSKDRRFSYSGRIIDQDGSPVAGVRVTAELYREGILPSWSGGMVRQKRLESDVDGRFELRREKARMLTLRFEKKGYLFPPESSEGVLLDELSAAALRRLSDPEDPVIVRAWKRHRPDENVLVGDGVFKRFRADGRFHLLSIRGHALEIAIEREGSYESRGAWSARLRVPGGELQEDIMGLPYEAPADDYSPVWGARFASGSGGDAHGATRRFFLRRADRGLHAHLRITFRPEQGLGSDAAVMVAYRFNTSGSRNLMSAQD